MYLYPHPVVHFPPAALLGMLGYGYDTEGRFCRNRPVWAPNKKGRSGDYLMVGKTNGGRSLSIPVRANAATMQLRPITGWESSPADLSKYGKGERR